MLESSSAALGGFHGKLVGNEIRKLSRCGIEANDLHSLGFGNRSGRWREVSKQRNIGIGRLAPIWGRSECKPIGGRMRVKLGNRLWGLLGGMSGN